MHSGQRPAHGHPLLYMGIRGRNEAHTLKRPWSEYLQKDGSSELTRFVTDTGIVPNRTKKLPGLPWPPAPPRHRNHPARPSMLGTPPGETSSRLQRMSPHRGCRFPSGSRVVTSTGNPITPAPARYQQVTQPRLRVYRRFPTASMLHH